MQTGLWGFSAWENQLEERTRDSREAWQKTRSAVTHSPALALIKLAGFCRKHTNKLRRLTEHESRHVCAVLGEALRVDWLWRSNYRRMINTW